MQLFTRSRLLSGPIPDVMAYAADITSYVSDKIGREVALWSVGFGAPAGTMVWAVRAEGLADVSAMQATLMADDAYHAKLAAGTQYLVGPATDALGQPIHGELGDPPPLGSVAAVTSAVIGNGAYAAAVGWGVEMAQYADSVTGMSTTFMMDRFGTFGQVTWVGVAEDAAAAEAAGDKLESDAGYVDKLSAVGDLFVPGSGHRMMATRVA